MSNNKETNVDITDVSDDIEANCGDGRCIDVERMAWSPAEVSKAIGLSLPRVYDLIRSERIRSIRVNNRYLIPLSTLQKDLERLVGQEIKV